MAQVIETGGDRVIERRTIDTVDSGAGWAVALIIVVALAVGAFVWARYRAPAAAPQSPGASVNVSLPSAGGSSDTGGSGSTGGTGGTGGTQTGGY
jgi:hypothetical protein